MTLNFYYKCLNVMKTLLTSDMTWIFVLERFCEIHWSIFFCFDSQLCWPCVDICMWTLVEIFIEASCFSVSYQLWCGVVYVSLKTTWLRLISSTQFFSAHLLNFRFWQILKFCVLNVHRDVWSAVLSVHLYRCLYRQTFHSHTVFSCIIG